VAWLALFRVAALPASVIAGLNVAGVDAFPILTKYVDDTIAKKGGILGSIWRASATPEVVNTIIVSGVCLLIYLALGFVGTRLWRLGQTAMSASPVRSPRRTVPLIVLCTATIVFSTVVLAAGAGVQVLSLGMYLLVAVILIAVTTPTINLTAPSELPARRPAVPGD